jgi:branched-chain amino acid transport system ATP-binding protein
MCVSGINPIRAGRIVFDGEEISGVPANRLVGRGLAQVPEGRKIFPRLTVLENLEMGAFLRSDRAELEADKEKVFALFPILRDRQSQLGGTLSGGEQQMLAIGRALMSRPKMLLMDEPSMGIAPILVIRIFDAVRELNREGMTVLLVEQNARQALKLAHRGYVLENGRIVMTDDAAKLAESDEVRKAYLGIV